MRGLGLPAVDPFRAGFAGCALGALFLASTPTLFAAQARIVRVAAQSAHERCVDLMAQQPLSYTFAAQRPLEFSIRHRDGTADVSDVQRKARSAKGKIVARSAGTYCARWENSEMHGMTLEYHLTLHKPPRSK